MEVSIIIPVYNQEKYIIRCLDSLKNQTFSKSKYQVIIINDGSTDSSENIISNYIAELDNFTLYNQMNKGLFESRKKGLQLAQGNYIGWVDADDFVEPNFIEVLYNLLVKNNSELAYCNYDFYPQKITTKEKWFREYKGKVDVDFIERNSQPWNKLVKKQLLDTLNIGELFLNCFDEAYIKCLLEARNPVFTRQKLYHYQVGTEGTMSSSYSNVDHYKKFIESSKSLRKEMEYLCSENDYWRSYFDYRIIYYSLITMVVAANSSDKSTFNELKDKTNGNNNTFFKSILIKNFGFFKYLILGKIINKNYYFSKIICYFAFPKR